MLLSLAFSSQGTYIKPLALIHSGKDMDFAHRQI